MRIIRIGVSSLAQSAQASALAIGNFDGVHRGHKAVLDTMLHAAHTQNLQPSVLTFYPHPRQIFAPHLPAFLLQTPAQKFAQLRAAGVAQCFVLRFDAATIALSAEAFIAQVIHAQCLAAFVATGENFRFGHKRQGTTDLLAAQPKLAAVAVPHVLHAGEVCSSSAIRAALSSGNVAHATALLGRPHAMIGRVVHGDGRGATIGFPTANIALPKGILRPAHGVYAVTLQCDGAVHHGVANFGTRPTFDGEEPRLEVHLLDYQGDMYGKRVEVALMAYLRGEQKFADGEALKTQIQRDCVSARDALRTNTA
jgi:riboflavin kinase/FMN adenylyltransferase